MNLTFRKRQNEPRHSEPGTVSSTASPPLPLLTHLQVSLVGLSVATRFGSQPVLGLQLHIDRNSRARLLSVHENTLILRVTDTVRALPTFEIEVEWNLAFTFVEPISEREVRLPQHWHWLMEHSLPYTSELVATLTQRMGLAPLILPPGRAWRFYAETFDSLPHTRLRHGARDAGHGNRR